MSEREHDRGAGAGLPDFYDRQIAALHDLPDVIKTSPATMRVGSSFRRIDSVISEEE